MQNLNELSINSTSPELAGVKLVSCDVDGVQTDGGLYYNEQGQCLYKFHVLDGMGLKNLMKAGVITCFITASKSQIIRKRAETLGIDHCIIGCDSKLETLMQLSADLGISLAEVAHIGDDINDKSVLEAVGYPVTVPNGHETVLEICTYVTKRSGGNGAVRDLCDAILQAKTNC